ncbi:MULTISPECIES: TetR/AcrR family transcriptional regulator [Streptomyces]|uniref:TetR/AcrR family transcriptional regulator n=2 Tax=Streptomyces TaxID=1883 RepID=A0ABV9J951_9ACTN
MPVDVTPERTRAAATGVRRRQRPRADAARNRERIVAVARDLFVVHGPEAPLDEIAKRAGIGNATLYRHFADRRSLLHAVLLFTMCRLAEHAERAVEENLDSFVALRQFLHHAVDERAGVVCGLLVDKEEQLSVELSAQRRRVESMAEELVERARRDGHIRTDVGFQELIVSMSQLARPLPGIYYRDEDAHRRLQLFLDGLRVFAASRRASPAGAEDPAQCELNSRRDPVRTPKQA